MRREAAKGHLVRQLLPRAGRPGAGVVEDIGRLEHSLPAVGVRCPAPELGLKGEVRAVGCARHIGIRGRIGKPEVGKFLADAQGEVLPNGEQARAQRFAIRADVEVVAPPQHGLGPAVVPVAEAPRRGLLEIFGLERPVAGPPRRRRRSRKREADDDQSGGDNC